ncbi:Protein of unknown function [Pontibacter lucknowensis]|uniref:DUF3293 domain-containing protein n=2 Tax=Pontibacter lucknowensis TaxID=1077936 RepID=A0A1N6TIB8_9BACT|nr:Protein of unknown function [Pontibacter lucknowensis]
MQTDYSFTNDSQAITIRLDQNNPDLLAYLQQESITSWAYITAWNPLSFPQTEEYNHSQQQILREQLKDYKVFEGEGKGRDGKWPAEASYFIAGISRDKACEIGLDFGQTAILVSSESLEPELVILHPPSVENNNF